jgi:chromosome segregation ATPase
VAADFTVTAIIAAFNEADLIGQVIAGMWAQGVGVYLIDHGSTDDTVAVAEKLRGAGLLGVERFPEGSGFPSEDAGRFAWEHLLKRKEALAHELSASWFIHSDADEFRESPWRDLNLRDAIQQVDALGYNAIDFAVYNFWPTHDRFRRGDDVQQAFPLCERGAHFDKLQVKCWKRTGSSVDLASTGGHDAQFPGRKVFPIRFILRHYPIRGQAHGERKIFRERRPRFVAEERARDWHQQYEQIAEGQSLLRDPATLTKFDPEAARLESMLNHRGVEEALARQAGELERIGQELWAVRSRLEEREREIVALIEQAHGARGALADAQVRIAALEGEANVARGEVQVLRQSVEARDAVIEASRAESAAQKASAERATQGERSASDEVARLRAELERLQRDGGEVRVALGEAKARAEIAESALRRLDQERRDLLEQTTVERERLRSEREQVQSEHSALEAEHQRLRAEHQGLRGEHELLRGQHDEWLAERERLRGETTRLREELSVESAERERLRVERDQLRVERDQLRVERDQLRVERDRLGAERDQLRGERDARERSRAALADERFRLEERAHYLEQRFTAARSELAQAMDQLHGAEARIDAFYASRTWRWLAPARIAWKLVGKE